LFFASADGDPCNAIGGQTELTSHCGPPRSFCGAVRLACGASLAKRCYLARRLVRAGAPAPRLHGNASSLHDARAVADEVRGRRPGNAFAY